MKSIDQITRRDFARLLGGGSALMMVELARGAGNTGMRRIETQGAPMARGGQQAKACQDLFHPWHKTWLERRAATRKVSVQEVLRTNRDQVLHWRDYMAQTWPEGYQEIQGLIEGLGVDEVAFHLPHLLEVPFKCTVVGVRDALGRPLVSKTDDVARYELGMNVLEITRPDQGLRHAHFHFGGTIWTVAGMNEAGLSMGMNGIPSPSFDRPGITALLSLHTILPKCSTVAQAIEHIRKLPVSTGGFSLLLGDATGAMTLVERTAVGTAVLRERKGEPLVHANDIIDPEFIRKNAPQSEKQNPNSSRRYKNADRLARAGVPLEKIMNDRSAEGAICQRGEQDMYTDFAIIFAPVEKKLTLWSGYPGPLREEKIDVAALLRS